MNILRRTKLITSGSSLSLRAVIAALLVFALLTLAYSGNYLEIRRDGFPISLVYATRSTEARPLAVQSLLIPPRVDLKSLEESPLRMVESAAELGAPRPPTMKLPDRKKSILLWTGIFGTHRKWDRFFDDMVDGRCPESRCEITTNRSLLDSADAVFFHSGDIFGKKMFMPNRRPTGQVWILWSLESPIHGSNNHPRLEELNDQINLTMSYNRKSDILLPYGLILKRNVVPTGRIARLFPRDVDLKTSDLVGTKKTHLVAWMASNCGPNSRRQDFIKEFQKHVQIDTYGSCGKIKCGVPEYARFGLANRTNCDDVLATYKFYLAFENSLCPDYVTEKFYRTLALGIVPIILAEMGHATLAPPGSYIDASKFTPESLAKYLNYLDRNNTAYSEYLQWRTDYDVFNAYPLRFLTCGLCDALHNLGTNNSGKSRGLVHHDLRASWLPDDQCQYWNKATLSLAPRKI